MKNKINVKFKVIDGKVHVKNLKATPEELKRVSNQIHQTINNDVLRNYNFNGTIKVKLG